MSMDTTVTLTLFPISLYRVLFETSGGQMKDVGDCEFDDDPSSTKLKSRSSSLGEKYRSLRGSRMRTAFESPLDCAERNLSKMAVVCTREISEGAVNGGSEGKRTSSSSFICKIEPARSTSFVYPVKESNYRSNSEN